MIGTRPINPRTFSTMFPSNSGSPGPGDSSRPDGCISSITSAGVVAGTAITSHPRLCNRRRMLYFRPTSVTRIRLTPSGGAAG